MSARVILLGTGTGVPDPDRDFTHLVWEGPGGTLLVDVGGGTYGRLLRVGVDPQQLGGILLTHSHCDHINGLPALLFSLWLAGRRTEPLPIYGLVPTLELARKIVDAMNLEGIAAPITWQTITAGDTIPLGDDAWTLTTAPTRHSRPCVALRWQERESGRAITYSCDTAPCPEVETLAQGAEVLIHEATTPGPFPSHSSPQEVGEVAVRAGVKRLILVHYSPRWTMPEAEALDAIRSAGFEGIAEIGRDLQVIPL